MSAWHKLVDGDVDIDFEKEEVNFYVCSDRDGNVYLTVDFEQMKEIIARLSQGTLCKEV